VLRGDQVESRHLGLAVSAIAAHQRLHIQQERAAAVEQARAVADYAGVVGEVGMAGPSPPWDPC